MVSTVGKRSSADVQMHVCRKESTEGQCVEVTLLGRMEVPQQERLRRLVPHGLRLGIE
jgi:hypothetical protein